MKEYEAINFLENLPKGSFISIKIPVFGESTDSVTAMYMGKDKEGRYNFADTGRFVVSQKLIENGKIRIEKEYNGDIARDIHVKVRKEELSRQARRNRDAR